MRMTLHERLESIARDVFGDDGIVLTDETTAKDVPEWDSLGHVNFMYSVEQEFGVEFSADEFAGLSSIGALKRELARKGQV
jgi:acyl carrier protein